MNRRLSHRVMQFLVIVTALGALPPRLAGQISCGAWNYPVVQGWTGIFTLTAPSQTVNIPNGSVKINQTVTAEVTFSGSGCNFGTEPGGGFGLGTALVTETQTLSDKCGTTVSISGGGTPTTTSAVTSLRFTTSTFQFSVYGITVPASQITTSCGESFSVQFDAGIGPYLTFPLFDLPPGGPQPLKMTKAFQTREIVPLAGDSVLNWTLTVDLTPVLWCKPGMTISVPEGGLPLSTSGGTGKPWYVEYGSLSLPFTTSQADPAICKATAPSGPVLVYLHDNSSGSVTRIAQIIGNRSITVRYGGTEYWVDWHTDGLTMNMMTSGGGISAAMPNPFNITLTSSLAGLYFSLELNTMDDVVKAMENLAFEDIFLDGETLDAWFTHWTLIQDPGSVSLAVMDSNGLTAGRLPDGRTTMDIPGSFYMPSDTNPVVVLAPGAANGSMEVLLHGVNTGPYSLAISTGRGAKQTPLVNTFSGNINRGANVAYRAVINPQTAQQSAAAASIVVLDLNGDGTVNCADIAAVRNAFGMHTGQGGFNAWADVDASGLIDITDLALVAQQLPAAMTCQGVSPAAGAGTGATMAFTFTDAKGWQDLGVVNILVNNFLDGRRACYLAYSRPLDTLFLINDAGDGGGSFAGSAVLHAAAGSIHNSQCTVSWGSSPASGSGNTLALTLTIGFTTGFAGNKVVYTASRDVADNSSGWQAMGVWQVSGGTQTTTTSVAGMSPSRGSGLNPTVFTFNFSDSKGYQDLGVVNILVNNFLDGRHACYLAYSRPLDTLFLINDAGDGGGQFAGSAVLHAAAGSLQNSQCTVGWGVGAVNADGNTLALTLTVGFNPGFAGNRIVHLAARDAAEGNNTGWQTMGSWTVQ